MEYFLLVPCAYLLGSIPFGVIVTRMTKGVDVRKYGSGNTGMTNVLRTAGLAPGILVLVFDMSKAAVAVIIARAVSDSAGLEVAAALSTLIGHIWPVFIGFRGGRGTAPGYGALIAFSPFSGLAAAAAGLPLIGVFRYVSLGSIAGSTAGGVTLILLALFGYHSAVYALYAAVGVPIVLVKHRDNIKRLLAGEERKLGKAIEKHASQSQTERAAGN